MNKYGRIVLVLAACTYFWHSALTYTDWHFIDWVNLIFHEAGHSIFSFFGMFIKISAGSAFQILLPLFISIYFFLHGQKVSGSIVLLWVGQNFVNVSIYARDALLMNLPLLGGDSVIHDWNYILGVLGMLGHAELIGSILNIIGLTIIGLGTVFALYFVIDKDSPLS